MDPIKSRREFLREAYLFTCGMLVAIALIAPIAGNIAQFWKASLAWAFGVSPWLGGLYLLLFVTFLPGMAIMAKRAITTGVEPMGERLNEYLDARQASTKDSPATEGS